MEEWLGINIRCVKLISEYPVMWVVLEFHHRGAKMLGNDEEGKKLNSFLFLSLEAQGRQSGSRSSQSHRPSRFDFYHHGCFTFIWTILLGQLVSHWVHWHNHLWVYPQKWIRETYIRSHIHQPVFTYFLLHHNMERFHIGNTGDITTFTGILFDGLQCDCTFVRFPICIDGILSIEPITLLLQQCPSSPQQRIPTLDLCTYDLHWIHFIYRMGYAEHYGCYFSIKMRISRWFQYVLGISRERSILWGQCIWQWTLSKNLLFVVHHTQCPRITMGFDHFDVVLLQNMENQQNLSNATWCRLEECVINIASHRHSNRLLPNLSLSGRLCDGGIVFHPFVQFDQWRWNPQYAASFDFFDVAGGALIEYVLNARA